MQQVTATDTTSGSNGSAAGSGGSGGTTSSGGSGGTTSSGGSGGTTSSGGSGGTATGATTPDAGCPSGEGPFDGVCVLIGPCGPETTRVGDTCVTLECAASSNLPCQLDAGGLGLCQSGACLDLYSDPSNCGGFGYVCPESTACSQGFCRFDDGGFPGCASGYEPTSEGCGLADCTSETDNQQCAPSGFCCGGVCLYGDSENCGGCGITCPAWAVCASLSQVEMAAGSGSAWNDRFATQGCVIANDCGPASPPWQICRLPTGQAGSCCGDKCVDDSLECLTTSCTDPGSACVAADGGQGLCCAGACIPTRDICDLNGGCQVCGPGEQCTDGVCTPYPDCAASQSAITTCLTDAGTPGICCGPACVDPNHDPLNCITCGRACALDHACCGDGPCDCFSCGPTAPCPDGYLCDQGTCLRIGCDGTNSFCAVADGGLGECCGNACIVPSAAGGPCAGCDSTCPTGTACVDGACLLADGGTPCPYSFPSPFRRDAACPPGHVCWDDCIPVLDCSPTSQEPGFGGCIFGPNYGAACCGDSCVDLLHDPQNCGSCGVTCPSGICALPGPAAPSEGEFGPSPYCVPASPTADCAASCAPGALCVDGDCIGGVCGLDSLGRCVAENGTVGVCCGPGVCAHPIDDPQNCGMCGNACPAGQTCVAGACSGSPECGPGRMFGFCGPDAGTSHGCCPGAGCTDLATDPLNCGACEIACPPGLTCVDGACS